METLQAYRDRVREIDGWLKEAGIRTKPYVNPPLHRDVFALTMDRNHLRLWPGQATVEVATDKKLRQAVIVATEDRREITQTYVISTRQNDHPTKRQVFDSFPVFVPRRRFGKWSVKDMTTQSERERRRVEQERQGHNRFVYYTTQWEVTASIVVPPAETTFLVGYDERRQFISMLPKRVNSVEKAHRVLRPAGVPADAPRQGEWFFVPVSKRTSAKLDEYVQAHPTQLAMAPLEWGSSHHAVRIRMDGQWYATMVVYDARSDHHGPLKLNGWHRIVRNNEVVPRNSQTRVAQRMWD